LTADPSVMEMESKTIKHFKKMAALQICQTNSVLRLHYRSECDNIALASTESHMTKASMNLECKFCYSRSPNLKVFRGSKKKLQSSNKRKYKPVYMMCRVCKNKYPKEYATKLGTNKEDHLNNKFSKNVDLCKNEKNPSKDSIKNIEKKTKKKTHKDVNAGLVIPSSTTTTVQNFKAGSKNSESKKIQSSYQNDKILQMLLKILFVIIQTIVIILFFKFVFEWLS
jgi:hypothetical protein